ncbi:MAG: hypothetical protein ABEJ47_01875, partial [Halorhabdus sp.]
MEDPLPVHVNREELHDIAVPASFEATGSFDVRLVNHGQPLHVHLHLDDDLSAVANLEATNHYVDGETERRVSVSVREGATVRGKLKVVSGYGSQTRYVDVVLTEPDEEEGAVRVDESLAEPQPVAEDDSEEGLVDQPVLAVAALAVGALAVAAAIAFAVQAVVVGLGALAVLAGVLVAVYVLFV